MQLPIHRVRQTQVRQTSNCYVLLSQYSQNYIIYKLLLEFEICLYNYLSDQTLINSAMATVVVLKILYCFIRCTYLIMHAQYVCSFITVNRQKFTVKKKFAGCQKN